MKYLVEKIANKEYDSAKDIFESEMSAIVEKKLLEAKKATSAKMMEQPMGQVGPTVPEKRKTGVIEDTIEEKYGKGYVSAASKIEKAMKKKGIEPNSSDKYRKEMERLDAQYAELKAKDKKIDEDVEELDEARIKIVKARVRGGKIQRRKKISNVPGMTIRSGRLIRMSPAERRRRRLGQKRGKIKRRAKLSRTLMKRQRSLRKRKSLGL